MSGRSARNPATTVLLPTPEGPERTVSRACLAPPGASAAPHARWTGESAVEPSSPRSSLGSPRWSDITAELVLQCGALIGTQSADSPRFRDAKPLHDLACPHLANTWHGLKERRDLHLAHRVVGLALLQYGGQGASATLQVVLDLRTILACLRSLLEGRCALIGSEGRKSHSGSPRVSNRKHWFERGK